jgi:ATP adenylyltransferase
METLWTPWRYKYIVSDKGSECIFCDALLKADNSKSLVIHRGKYNLVMLNRYPYSNGHIMIAPNEHIASPELSGSDTLIEMLMLVQNCLEALRESYKPCGFNIGMNLGRAAGAGIEDHYHLHIVPRWEGDTNFMTVLNDVRLIPQDLNDVYDQLKPLLDKIISNG